MRSSLAVLTIALAAGCSSEVEVEGSNSLYMGHSYFRRQAEAMDEFAAAAGIEGHTSETFFRGGYYGSAYAIWDDPASKQEIQDHLDVKLYRMEFEAVPQENKVGRLHIAYSKTANVIKKWGEIG